METANNLCLEYGFHSYYHAKAIIDRNAREEGAGEDMWIGAISIGLVALIGAPYEMFDTNGIGD